MCVGKDAETLDKEGKLTEAQRRAQKGRSVHEDRQAQIEAIKASKNKNEALSNFLTNHSSKEKDKSLARVSVAFQHAVNKLRNEEHVEDLEQKKTCLREFRTKIRSTEQIDIDEMNKI